MLVAWRSLASRSSRAVIKPRLASRFPCGYKWLGFGWSRFENRPLFFGNCFPLLSSLLYMLPGAPLDYTCSHSTAYSNGGEIPWQQYHEATLFALSCALLSHIFVLYRGNSVLFLVFSELAPKLCLASRNLSPEGYLTKNIIISLGEYYMFLSAYTDHPRTLAKSQLYVGKILKQYIHEENTQSTTPCLAQLGCPAPHAANPFCFTAAALFLCLPTTPQLALDPDGQLRTRSTVSRLPRPPH
ncbi:hypothetical protein B0H10DRAFT_660197 [Mycena sp. CBHHK59/15]|nr:hypothetical protein B0H10DRAFT_660197 [Mycena sp. CBHHK59/15]